MTIVYKVVSRRYEPDQSTTLISAAGFQRPNDPWTLVYSTEQKTIPRVGKLFAFSDYNSAFRFLMSACGSEIWTAEASNTEIPTKCIPWSESGIERFWADGNMLGLYVTDAPVGTLFCDDIILKEKRF